MAALVNQTIENSSKSLFIEQPKKKFTKISKDLHGLMLTGCDKCTAGAYQTYSYCISMHPDSIITPAKIAACWNFIAEKNKGKKISERTARRHLGELEKVGLVSRSYHRDKEGKFMGGVWQFFSLPAKGQKWPTVEDKDKSNEINDEDIEIDNSASGQKWPPDYNKERARVYKTNNKTNSPPSPPKKSNDQKADDAEKKMVDFFKHKILKTALKDDFNRGTYRNLKKLGVSHGQITTLISMMNSYGSAKGCGWMIKQVENIGLKDIVDADEVLKKKQEELEAIKKEKPVDTAKLEKESATKEEVRQKIKQNYKKTQKQLIRDHKEIKAEKENKPVIVNPATMKKAKDKFFKDETVILLKDHYEKFSDYQLMQLQEFRRISGDLLGENI